MHRVWLAAVIGLAVVAGAAAAQRPIPTRPTPPPPTRPTGRAAGDTVRLRGDSAAAKDTADKANFAPADSVMERLLKSQNADVTRYQGKSITYDATTNAIGVTTNAIVLRDSQLVKSDSSIKYGGAGSAVQVNSGAKGRNIIVTPGQAAIYSKGAATYDIKSRRAAVSSVTTSVAQNGENLYITGAKVAVVAGRDSAVKASSDAVYYLRDGTVTACDDSIPDYYFKSKEIKRTGSFVVARPAVLYIGDVPVMWLPFLFQDVRGGRHSGLLAPNVGVSDIVRNSPSYRRSVEGLGWYFALSDYVDAQGSLDWRSSAGQTVLGDDGFMRYNGEMRYNWLERYLGGYFAVSQTTQGTSRNTAVSLEHHEDFSRNSKLRASLNYSSNTILQRQTTVNPYSVLSTIRSTFNYDHTMGPAHFTLGGTRTQYPGRTQVEQGFPTLSVSTSPINLASWLTWTPNVSYSSTQTLGIDQVSSVGFLLPKVTGSGLDTLVTDSSLKRSSYASNLSFDTPLQISGYNLGDHFTITSQRQDFPQLENVTDLNSGVVTPRVYATTYSTELDWTPSFTLPPLARNNFNLTPSLTLNNVDGGAFALRNHRTGGVWVHQKKRPTFGLSASPTLFGLFGGFGPFTRIRHSISPTMSYSYAPAADPGDAYLVARGYTRHSADGTNNGYLGGLAQNAISFGLSTNIEAKRRTVNDSNPEAGEKIKLATINFTSLGYDFERASATHSRIRGLTSQNFGYSVRSDLLPGFDASVNYSLFEGNTLSDSARFKPHRDNISASFQFSNTANPFAIFSRLFGQAVPESAPSGAAAPEAPADNRYAQQIASQPVAGRASHNAAFLPTITKGWQASFNFTAATPRPVTGTNVIAFDPTVRCAYLNSPATRLQYDQCVIDQQLHPTTPNAITSGVIGSAIYSVPNTTSLSSQLSFNITEHWAASVNNSYDFELKQFASQVVSLQRDLHDWRAIFAFTQAPNGAFAFNFLISLKAEPDLKFDYHKATYRGFGY
jgi:hypothetical protein